MTQKTMEAQFKAVDSAAALYSVGYSTPMVDAIAAQTQYTHAVWQELNSRVTSLENKNEAPKIEAVGHGSIVGSYSVVELVPARAFIVRTSEGRYDVQNAQRDKYLNAFASGVLKSYLYESSQMGIFGALRDAFEALKSNLHLFITTEGPGTPVEVVRGSGGHYIIAQMGDEGYDIQTPDRKKWYNGHKFVEYGGSIYYQRAGAYDSRCEAVSEALNLLSRSSTTPTPPPQPEVPASVAHATTILMRTEAGCVVKFRGGGIDITNPQQTAFFYQGRWAAYTSAMRKQAESMNLGCYASREADARRDLIKLTLDSLPKVEGAKVVQLVDGTFNIVNDEGNLDYHYSGYWVPARSTQRHPITNLRYFLELINANPELSPKHYKLLSTHAYGSLVRRTDRNGSQRYIILRYNIEGSTEVFHPGTKAWGAFVDRTQEMWCASAARLDFASPGELVPAFNVPGLTLGYVVGDDESIYWRLYRTSDNFALQNDGSFAPSGHINTRRFACPKRAAEFAKTLKLPSPADAKWRDRAFVCRTVTRGSEWGVYYTYQNSLGVTVVRFLLTDGSWSHDREPSVIGNYSSFASRTQAEEALKNASSPE